MFWKMSNPFSSCSLKIFNRSGSGRVEGHWPDRQEAQREAKQWLRQKLTDRGRRDACILKTLPPGHTQQLAHSKDKAASAPTFVLSSSVVCGQSLLAEKYQTADSPRLGHANKTSCKSKVPRPQSSLKVSSAAGSLLS